MIDLSCNVTCDGEEHGVYCEASFSVNLSYIAPDLSDRVVRQAKLRGW